jgi:hypothetical protein
LGGKLKKAICAALLSNFLTLGSAGMATAAEYVVIDRQDEAYTVFMKIPGEQLEPARAKIAADSKTSIIDWEPFRKKPNREIQQAIKVNEYRQYDLESGMIEFLRNFPATPIGVSWNGGIAITYGDYSHAQKEYQAYLREKDGYKPVYERDPKSDPLNPGSHFQAMLGKSYLTETKE